MTLCLHSYTHTQRHNKPSPVNITHKKSPIPAVLLNGYNLDIGPGQSDRHLLFAMVRVGFKGSLNVFYGSGQEHCIACQRAKEIDDGTALQPRNINVNLNRQHSRIQHRGNHQWLVLVPAQLGQF